mgnify:CR=1 FL=1|jgi:hypothetical protein
MTVYVIIVLQIICSVAIVIIQLRMELLIPILLVCHATKFNVCNAPAIIHNV